MSAEDPGSAPGDPPPAPSAIGRVIRAILFACAILALWNTLRHAELDRAAAQIAAIGAPIALVPLSFLAAYALHAAALRRVLAVLGRRASYLRLLSVVISAEAVIMTFPGGPGAGDVVSPSLLERRAGVPIPDGLATVAAKKALILLANAVYMAIALALGIRYLHAASPALLHAPGLEHMVLATAAGLFVGSIMMCKALLDGNVAARSHRLLGRIPSDRLKRWLDARKEGFLETDQRFARLFREHRGDLAIAAALLVGMWLAEGLDTLVILRLLRVDLSAQEVLSFEVIVVLLRSFAFMIPNAIGVQDAGYVAFLSAFGVHDAATVGVAFVLVKRAKELFWIIVGYALFLRGWDTPSQGSTRKLQRAA